MTWHVKGHHDMTTADAGDHAGTATFCHVQHGEGSVWSSTSHAFVMWERLPDGGAVAVQQLALQAKASIVSS
jgi:hypothetical protein